jgi:hypothetical protein
MSSSSWTWADREDVSTRTRTWSARVAAHHIDTAAAARGRERLALVDESAAKKSPKRVRTHAITSRFFASAV